MDCTNAFTAIPDSCKDGNGLLLFKGLIFSTSSQNFATAAAAGSEANWVTDIVSGALVPVHKIKEVEDLTAESTNWESASGDIVFLFEGKIRIKTTFYLTIEQHAALRAAKGKKGNVYFYDRAGNILGTTTNGTIFKGYSMSYINVENLKVPTADQPATSIVEIQLEYPDEMNESLRVISPYLGTVATRWKPYNLPVKTSTIVEQVGSIVADVVTFTVNVKSSSQTDNDGTPVSVTPITGLDTDTYTNFQFVVGGSVTAPSAMTESSIVDGQYTATVTGIATADTIQILPTITNLYTSLATSVTT